MAVKRELLLIVVLLIVIALLVKLVEFFQVNVVEGDASKFVLEDLNSKYPGADISIINITPMTNDNGQQYFQVKAKVTQDPDTPCPERSHIYYNYPAQNFVPLPPDVITHNCVVCAQGICNIAYPEEAIIASHTFQGTSGVQSYLTQYQNAVPAVVEKSDSWEVTWNSQSATQSYVVDIRRDGTVSSVSAVPSSGA